MATNPKETEAANARFQKTIRKVISGVLAEARRLSSNAAYGGLMSDGGASTLETQAEFYMDGMDGRVPQTWAERYTQALAEVEREEALAKARQDPEWEQFERLRQKFKGIY